MDIKETLEVLRPDTNKLIVLTLGVIAIYSIYYIGPDAMRLAENIASGLVGYLGASAKIKTDLTDNPPGLITGTKQ